MSGLCSDTTFTQLVRFATHKKLHQYREESQTALCLGNLEKNQSAGSLVPSESDASYHTGRSSLSGSISVAGDSLTSQDRHPTSNNAGADEAPADHSDFELVDWYGPGDEGWLIAQESSQVVAREC